MQLLKLGGFFLLQILSVKSSPLFYPKWHTCASLNRGVEHEFHFRGHNYVELCELVLHLPQLSKKTLIPQMK